MLAGMEWIAWWFDIAFAVSVAFIIGTLVEYWGHRWMHTRDLMEPVHSNHHLLSFAQGVLPEWRLYATATVPFAVIGFVVSFWGGIGAFIGATSFAFVAALSHQFSHERPGAIWWQGKPVHHLHHRYNQTEYNFGITTAVWDHVFRTYRALPYEAGERLPFFQALRSLAWKVTPETLYWNDILDEKPKLSAKMPEIKAFRKAMLPRSYPDGGIPPFSVEEMDGVVKSVADFTEAYEARVA